MVSDRVKQFLFEKGIIVEMTSGGIAGYAPENVIDIASQERKKKKQFDPIEQGSIVNKKNTEA